MSDISGIIKSTGVALEAQAFKMFGAAVESATTGALNKAFPPKTSAPSATNPAFSDIKNYAPGSVPASQRGVGGVYDPTWYSARIASGQGGFQPKGKFLFKIGFRPAPGLADLLRKAGYNSDLAETLRDLTFTVMNVDLPTVNYEYEEVNMYNFRTKVLKRIEFKDLSFSFHDNVANTALNFFNTHMMVLSPVTRSQWTAEGSQSMLEKYGLALTDSAARNDSSYRGVIPGNLKSILSEIRIEHYYVEVTQSGSPIDSVKLNEFVFVNPRINEFSLGGLDHASNDPNEIRMTVNFDTLRIVPSQPGTATLAPSLQASDIMDGMDVVASSSIRGQPITPARASNPLVDILSRQGQRVVQTGVSNALNRVFGNTPAGRALSGAIGSVSGALGAAASKTLGGIGSNVAEQISSIKLPFVKDNSGTASSSQTSSSGDGG